MLFSFFLLIIWIELISGWEYKAVTRYPITAVTYNCPVPLNLRSKPILLKFYYPDTDSSPLIFAFGKNLNLQDASLNVFSKTDALYTHYSNIPLKLKRYPEHPIKFKRYVEVPPTEDELYNYEFKESSPFLEEYYRDNRHPLLDRTYEHHIKIRVHIANRLPFVRTEKYCTGWKFLTCWAEREDFWYEGELQYYFQYWFKNRAYIIVATDKVYFSWLQFIKKMQIRAGIVLRISKVAHRPIPYITEAIQRLSCHWNQGMPDGQNSIYYSLSMEMLLSQTDLNIAKNSPGFPYIIVAVPTRLAKEYMTIARKFFMEETIAELIGFFSTVFKISKLDVVFVNTDTQEHTLFEAYDTQTKFDNLKNISSQLKQHFLATVKDTGNTHNIFNLKADIFTKLISERTQMNTNYVVAPIVMTFSEAPTLFLSRYDNFVHKKHILPFIRELKQANAHALFINSETTHYQRKMPIKDTDVDVSVFPIHPHPLHLIYDMFLITRDHVIDRISQVMRVDKQQLTFDTDFTPTLPESKLNGAFLDLMAMIPEKSVNSDVLLAKEYFTENGALSTYEYLQNFLRPRELKIGETSFSNYLNEEVVADCGASNMLFPVKTTIVENTQQDVQAGEVPIKHLNFEKCLSKFFWSSVSYKVAVIFVDTLTKDWVDAASEATAAFATQGLRREGMIIFVSSNIPAELQKHREKDVYTIDSAVCSDIKQCVLDRIFYSKLVNGR